MMFELVFVLSFVLLVTSNPLQVTTCPLATYRPNYEPELPLPSNCNPCQQQNTVQYRLAQTVPYSYNSLVNGYNLDNGLINTQPSRIDNYVRTYSQNGANINYYSSNTNKTPKVVNNYIIVPTEYIQANLGSANVIHNRNVDKNRIYDDVNSHKENVKCKREEGNKVRDIYSNFENTENDLKFENKAHNQVRGIENEVSNKKQTSFKNSENNHQMSESTKRKKNINVEDNREEDNIRHPKIKSKASKKSKKNKNSNQKSETDQKSILKDPISKTDVDIVLKDKENGDKKTADVDVSFDIDEECTWLENRKSRNNCYEPNTNSHPQLPRGFPGDIESYLNNVMSNPHFKQNYLSSFGDIPYNLDYLHQIPQQNSCRRESSRRNKSRRKISKSSKNYRKKSNKKSRTTDKQKANIERNQKETLNACKVVELEPQFINNEDAKPIILKTQRVEANKTKTDHQTELSNLPEDTLEAPQPPGEADWIQITADDHTSEVYIAPVNDDLPDADPELPGEYYPDFTSDKMYLSKEEYEYNFHDRHYYDSDNRAEMSLESRKYEKLDGRHSKHINDVIGDAIKHDQNKQKTKHKNIISPELEFRTPPPLLFPDFKTEMINKDTSRSKHGRESVESHIDQTHHYQNPFYEQKESKPIELGIETVFARSKVIKYGATPNREEPSMASKEIRNEDSNLFSTDGRTTVIIAKSLSYPEY